MWGNSYHLMVRDSEGERDRVGGRGSNRDGNGHNKNNTIFSLIKLIKMLHTFTYYRNCSEDV